MAPFQFISNHLGHKSQFSKIKVNSMKDTFFASSSNAWYPDCAASCKTWEYNVKQIGHCQ